MAHQEMLRRIIELQGQIGTLEQNTNRERAANVETKTKLKACEKRLAQDAKTIKDKKGLSGLSRHYRTPKDFWQGQRAAYRLGTQSHQWAVQGAGPICGANANLSLKLPRQRCGQGDQRPLWPRVQLFPKSALKS